MSDVVITRRVPGEHSTIQLIPFTTTCNCESLGLYRYKLTSNGEIVFHCKCKIEVGLRPVGYDREGTLFNGDVYEITVEPDVVYQIKCPSGWYNNDYEDYNHTGHTRVSHMRVYGNKTTSAFGKSITPTWDTTFSTDDLLAASNPEYYREPACVFIRFIGVVE